MLTHRTTRAIVYVLSALLLATLVGGSGLLNYSPPTALAQFPGGALDRNSAPDSNTLLPTHAELLPDFSFSLSPTNATPSTYRVALTIGNLGGVTPPSSNWYGPGGAPVSRSCAGGPNLVREFFYSGGVLYEVRDYFYISPCTREPGQYNVTVAPDYDGTFTITVPPTVYRTYLPFVQQPPHPPSAFGKVSPADGATGQQPLSLTLDWEDSVDVEAYAYCYDTTDDDACTNWVESGTSSQAEIEGLSENTTYYWQVRATNSLGTTYADGSETDDWSFTTGEEFAGLWTQLTDSAAWAARASHASVLLSDGSIVLMGGRASHRFNSVYRSTDNGVNWVQMADYAEWTARSGSSAVALPDDSIVLTGGTDGSRLNDVWRSTDQGATWTELTAAAPWAERNNHTTVVLSDGSIVLMGGVGANYWQDVWRSTDQGATWTQQTAAAEWAARNNHTSVALSDDSIVLMGGFSGLSSGDWNDVWRSTDQGATWTQQTAAAPWAGRSGHTSVVLTDGSIVLMGGKVWGGVYWQDVWRSTDQGATWTQLTAAAPWTARSEHASVALPDDSIVLMGGTDGTYLHDVWRLEMDGERGSSTR